MDQPFIHKTSAYRFWAASIVLNALVILLAASALIGWQFDIQSLKSIFPGIVNMNPTTAACFILAGLVLSVIRAKSAPKAARALAYVAGAALVAIGGFMLAKLITGFDIHIDQFIFHDKILAVTAFSNNRIAPNTALNLVLSGSALILMLRSRFRAAQILAFITSSISLLAIVGYLYSVKNLYGFLSYTPMALNTAIGFLMLSVAVQFTKPAAGYMRLLSEDTIAGTVLRNLLPASIIIPLVLGELHLFGEQFDLYDKQFGLSLVIVLIVVIFFLIFYYIARTIDSIDGIRQASQKSLIQKTAELEKAKIQVEQANADLDRRLADSGRQNDTLSGTKKAMLNLLEDLNLEKQNIELARAKDEALLGSIGDGVFAIDNDRKIILFNSIAETLSGYSAAEVVGKRYTEALKFVFEDTGRPNDEFVNTALSGTKTQMANPTALITRAGKSVSVADSAAPVRDPSGKVIGAVIVFRDVAHERQIDKAKTEFVSLASHQLRTPLTAISWYTELLLGGDAGKVSKPQKEFLTQIHDSNLRMIELVNSLLNVSRIDLGTLASDPEKTDIVALCDSVLGELAPQIAARSEKIVRSYPAGGVSLFADPKLMRIVAQNILSNAVKYTPEKGSVTISVSIDAEKFRMTVADTGYGIPDAQKSKIFTKLFRADNAKEKDPDGNGLGLYIAKAVIDAHGGSIRFDSQEGKGTTFFVELPASGMKRIEGSKTLSS